MSASSPFLRTRWNEFEKIADRAAPTRTGIGGFGDRYSNRLNYRPFGSFALTACSRQPMMNKPKETRTVEKQQDAARTNMKIRKSLLSSIPKESHARSNPATINPPQRTCKAS